MREIIEKALNTQCHGQFIIRERREGIYQVIIPFFYEDGDIVEVYIIPLSDNKIKISDLGMTVMRLSYSYEIDTPKKEEIFKKIIAQNRVNEDNMSIYLICDLPLLFNSIMTFIEAVLKVSTMEYFKREIIQDLFYEMLEEFIQDNLSEFPFEKNVFPIPERDDLEVDYVFNSLSKPIYLFGINNSDKSKIATICLLEFQKRNIQFRSVSVLRDFDVIRNKDRRRLESASDKIFPDFQDFQSNSVAFFNREYH
ncbi:MAG: hypothetical protein A2Y33_08010 [Spirochaetes bacterium GWF1_51_8]|nr:MAG: hypothetical protein A2Y33_08010 [Spirochaetes bacterium GWF1_51_8]